MAGYRRRQRRRRFIGPIGIGIAVVVVVGSIVLGGGAAPGSTAGAVASETDVPSSNPSPSPSVASATPLPVVAVASTEPGPSPVPPSTVPDAGEAEVDDAPYDGLTGYRWPIPNARLTLPYGPSPWGGWLVDGEKFHDGIDLATFCGDRVAAAHDGVVLAAGRHYDDHMGWIGDLTKYKARLDAKKLWGTLPIVVVTDDGNGYRSVYAHFSKVVVKKGQPVKAGQLLGYEGRTGRASGCHLHYGLFSPAETDEFEMDPVAARHMKLPGVEIARIDPQLVLPDRQKTRAKPKPSPVASATP